ncbi:MAG: HlyC/CorC family transporter, partial [Lachnospira sp.]|nr:HlyC/CorC family transporter [Lachnospira sp.]
EEEEYIEETENADEYIIEGMTPLDELEERFDITFDEDDFETLNGFLISKLDKIPEEEDEQYAVMVGEYEFKILTVENRMIKNVLVTKIAGDEENEDTYSEEEITKLDKKEKD